MGSVSADCILLDIEGTTTSINFVKDVLFKYVEDNIESFVKTKWNEPKVQEYFLALQKQSETDVEQGVEGAVLISPLPENASASEIEAFQNALISNVHWQMSCDRKTTPLKQLQGYMWTKSYLAGDVRGHVYEDVPVALKKWKEAGKRIYIYSSGSIMAQKLLFCHSSAGDMSQYLNGYYDTLTGSKLELGSYVKIAEKINAQPSNILFLTDNPKECSAALAAGMQTFIVVREGNAAIPQEEDTFPKIYSFDQLNIV